MHSTSKLRPVLLSISYRLGMEYALTLIISPNDARQVLNDISLVIEPGQKVGVVGRTGRLGSPTSKMILAMY